MDSDFINISDDVLKDRYKYDDKIISYLRNTVDPHRKLVYTLCNKVGCGLRGEVHDISKYEFMEAPAYCKRWTNGKGESGLSDKDKEDFKLALLHHIECNDHHLTHYCDDYELHPESIFDNNYMMKIRSPYDVDYCISHSRPMSLDAFKEMICDWIASGMIHNMNDGKDWTPGELIKYYYKNDHPKTIYPSTRYAIESMLCKLDEDGLKALTEDNLKYAYEFGINKFTLKKSFSLIGVV